MYDAIKLHETELRVKKLFANWYYRRLIAVRRGDLERCGLVYVCVASYYHEQGPTCLSPRRSIPRSVSPVRTKLVTSGCEPTRSQTSSSPFAIPPVFVPKPHTNDTKWPMCTDYRQLDDKSVKYALPLPRCDEVVTSVRDAKYFTTLDLQWGFLQMENDPTTAEYTAFTIPVRHYHFNVLPFGVTRGPGVFQR
jgi:hypothetical protein